MLKRGSAMAKSGAAAVNLSASKTLRQSQSDRLESRCEMELFHLVQGYAMVAFRASSADTGRDMPAITNVLVHNVL
jgi:hypothetical protein